MADRKISDLTALTTPASGDFLPIVDISEAAAASKNKRITIEELMRGVPDGTAAAPGIAFETDPNTGIYSPGADQLAVATNGTGRLFVDASGNVGVGTPPDTRLTLASPGSTTLNIYGQGRAAAFSVGVNATGSLINEQNNLPLVFNTNNTERLRITSAGLVGVGTSAPSNTAGFNQQLQLSGNLPCISIDNTGTGANKYSLGVNGVGALGVWDNTASAFRMYIDSAGLVGIGTSSPSTKLEVFDGSITAGSSGDVLIGRNSSSFPSPGAGYFKLGTNNLDGSNGGLSIFTLASDSFQERVRVDSSGRVGIGTTSPGNTLHLSGTNGVGIRIENTSNSISAYSTLESSGGLQANISGSGFFSWVTGGGEKARLDASGRLLVGTSTAKTNYFGSASIGSNFQVVGSTHAESSVIIHNQAANAQAPYLHLGKAKGTGYEIVSSGDLLGSFVYFGADGSAMRPAASIDAYVDGTPGANDMPGRLVFSTTSDSASSPTERMRIDSTGRIIGYTGGIELTRNIDSVGTLGQFINSSATTANQYGFYIRLDGDPNNTSQYMLQCYGGVSDKRAEIRSNGGLANYQANDVNLSDRNAKKDIASAADTWDCIKEWEIVNYRYKDQPDDADLNLGVIAQQVAESCPEVITVFQEATEDEPEKLGVKEQQMYWMAIKALQEAQVRIETLEAKVAALESA
jgi:hypothetical protein